MNERMLIAHLKEKHARAKARKWIYDLVKGELEYDDAYMYRWGISRGIIEPVRTAVDEILDLHYPAPHSLCCLKQAKRVIITILELDLEDEDSLEGYDIETTRRVMRACIEDIRKYGQL